MVLVDDLLMLPMRGVLWIVREIHNAAQGELVNEAESISTELSRLYMRLETGQISEGQFAAEEKILLERLENIEKRGSAPKEEGSGEEGQR